MKFKVGGRVVGEVEDQKVKNYKPKPTANTDPVVRETIIEALCNGIRHYQYLPGARERFLEALGVTDEQGKRRGTQAGVSEGTASRSPGAPRKTRNHK